MYVIRIYTGTCICMYRLIERSNLLSIYLSLSLYLSIYYLSIYLSISLSIYPSIYLSVYLSVYLPDYNYHKSIYLYGSDISSVSLSLSPLYFIHFSNFYFFFCLTTPHHTDTPHTAEPLPYLAAVGVTHNSNAQGALAARAVQLIQSVLLLLLARCELIHTHTHMNNIQTHRHLHANLHTHTHIHTYTDTHIHIHTYTYTHTHILTPWR
jgi:hypothetical protein